MVGTARAQWGREGLKGPKRGFGEAAWALGVRASVAVGRVRKGARWTARRGVAQPVTGVGAGVGVASARFGVRVRVVSAGT